MKTIFFALILIFMTSSSYGSEVFEFKLLNFDGSWAGTCSDSLQMEAKFEINDDSVDLIQGDVRYRQNKIINLGGVPALLMYRPNGSIEILYFRDGPSTSQDYRLFELQPDGSLMVTDSNLEQVEFKLLSLKNRTCSLTRK